MSVSVIASFTLRPWSRKMCKDYSVCSTYSQDMSLFSCVILHIWVDRDMELFCTLQFNRLFFSIWDIYFWAQSNLEICTDISVVINIQKFDLGKWSHNIVFCSFVLLFVMLFCFVIKWAVQLRCNFTEFNLLYVLFLNGLEKKKNVFKCMGFTCVSCMHTDYCWNFFS